MNPVNLLIATFAGGCFWCMVPPFANLPGVQAVTSGYMGGRKENPTYEEVSTGNSGYLEVIQVQYDPQKTTYEELLNAFWHNIDPTDAGGQFVDRGHQYKTAIFYHDEAQNQAALKSRDGLIESKRFQKPVVTEIRPAGKFYAAEDYHQDYYKKNPLRYKFYRQGTGRDEFIETAWKGDLKKKLTPLQYQVTQQCGTEPPFNNAYWDNKKKGIYVDVVSGEPLFISSDKFDSGTGWPSFTQPLEPGNIVKKEDKSLPMKRTEVRSKKGNSHLGHVFNDGPGPEGLRYCINSAALRFIPLEDLDKEGYGQFKSFFKTKGVPSKTGTESKIPK